MTKDNQNYSLVYLLATAFSFSLEVIEHKIERQEAKDAGQLLKCFLGARSPGF